ncbi:MULTISPECIES: bifunctional diguanylate cyclase/phosphodiesterase [Gammaproteobacteria]|uniref:putative bifunctional diguanylate cyclase/phosphodiesterase n=1 Tax=Gammaproteobacteria TaxID=1236 RepID=UPI000DD017A2|nr:MULTISPECIES: GGDEF domain-containing phosphodiesterase [Gammaproteobacteria]RTE86579.1 EAL domain-containing protein [Aliidiomarina sp. B3213]TCZ90866.1 EAL domain-containing protein [Lysobacter sp. N42]
MTTNREKQPSEARFRRLFDDTEAMSIQGYRADGTVVYWNNASEKIYGYTAEEALGDSLYNLIIPSEMCAEVKQAVAWMFEHQEGIPPARLNLQHKDGSTVPVYSSHTVVALEGDEPIMFCMDADMRALDLAEAEVQKLSYYDSLTELPNRRLLLERLASMMRNTNVDGSVAALLIIDLDDFHSINESLGYSSGDRVLMHCAKTLKRFCLGPDNLARLGKDEFVMLLPCNTSSHKTVAAEAELLAAQILKELESSLTLDNRDHQLNACVGITIFAHPAQTPGDELLRQADIALKAAKRSNTSTISFYDQDMESEIIERMELARALNYALAYKEMSIALQPQVDKGQKIIGFEALLRWQHPKFGTVPPNSFIPIAEATGSIIDIGTWVIEQACEILATWKTQKSRAHLKVSVNVSPVQFRMGYFADDVQKILKQTGADPKNLRLELTENIFTDDVGFTVEQMNSLRELGVSISLDDFGTGYASLAYLTQLPLDELKIDRTFVRDLGNNKQGELLTKTIINLGRSMNLEVIAEGVETAEQFKHLQNMGCENFQGYLFGKPKTDYSFYFK